MQKSKIKMTMQNLKILKNYRLEIKTKICLIFLPALFLIFFFSFFVFAFSASAQVKDAIAIRVMKNLDHLSPALWYMRNVPNPGNPKSMQIDGYEAVSDGRTVYAAAANINTSSNTIYTNIYIMSYNKDARESTVKIFSQLVKNWRFNINIDDFGICEDPLNLLLENMPCSSDFDCIDSDGTDYGPCGADKSKIRRDVKRLADLEDIKKDLTDYSKETGAYPGMPQGTYISRTSTSKWPSWQKELSEKLGTGISIDPINRFSGDCDLAGYDSETCWNETVKDFQCPNNSYLYQYSSLGICSLHCDSATPSNSIFCNNNSDCPDAGSGEYCMKSSAAASISLRLESEADASIPYSFGIASLGSDSACASSQIYANLALENINCCEPMSCSSFGYDCGTYINNCGQTIECGICVSPEECINGSCCARDCAGKECGDDGCGSSCGTCESGYSCDSSFQCVSACTDECGPKGEAYCSGTFTADGREQIIYCGYYDTDPCLEWSPAPEDCDWPNGCESGGCVCLDLDGDGYENYICGGDDCNDNNPSIHPNAPEICDGIDNDCDGLIDGGDDSLARPTPSESSSSNQYNCDSGGWCGDGICGSADNTYTVDDVEVCGVCEADCGSDHDNDGDGIGACTDNCPDMSNPDQGDADGDGIGDLCDDCYDYGGSCVELTITQGAWTRTFRPYAKADTASEFYCYDGNCANPYTTIPSSSNLADAYNFTKSERSNVFAYINANNNMLSLGFLHDKTDDGSGGSVDFSFSGNGWDMGVVSVSDDSGEFSKSAHGNWGWADCCTDGGMIDIANLDTSWSITITPSFISGINAWFIKVHGGVESGEYIPNLTDPVVISYGLSGPGDVDGCADNDGDGYPGTDVGGSEPLGAEELAYYSLHEKTDYYKTYVDSDGNAVYEYRSGFKDRHDLTDQNILCSQEDECPPEIKSLSLSSHFMFDPDWQEIYKFRVYVPPGTIYHYLRINKSNHAQIAAVSRLGQPPGDYSAYTYGDFEDNTNSDPMAGASLAQLNDQDYVQTDNGGILIISTGYENVGPYDNINDGWLYVDLYRTDGSLLGYDHIFRVNVEDYLEWYENDVDWDANGNPIPLTGGVCDTTDPNFDCDDTNPNIHPNATEICGNGVDEDCDGEIDEGCSVTYTAPTSFTFFRANNNHKDDFDADAGDMAVNNNGQSCIWKVYFNDANSGSADYDIIVDGSAIITVNASTDCSGGWCRRWVDMCGSNYDGQVKTAYIIQQGEINTAGAPSDSFTNSCSSFGSGNDGWDNDCDRVFDEQACSTCTYESCVTEEVCDTWGTRAAGVSAMRYTELGCAGSRCAGSLVDHNIADQCIKTGATKQEALDEFLPCWNANKACQPYTIVIDEVTYLSRYLIALYFPSHIDSADFTCIASHEEEVCENITEANCGKCGATYY